MSLKSVDRFYKNCERCNKNLNIKHHPVKNIMRFRNGFDIMKDPYQSHVE